MVGDDLTQLGRGVQPPASPEDAVLEHIPNPHPDSAYAVRLTAPEFTCVCPVTGQPDFAHLVIDYVPGAYLVESKSFKLLLGSFRNEGAFHEGATVTIAKRLADAVAPKWVRVAGYWYPRGGIAIDVHYQSAAPPGDVWIPDPGVSPYRARG